jgi:acetyl esterase/lipase
MGAMLLTAALPARAEPYPVEVHSNIPYGPLPAEQGDLYVPTTPPGKRPAVIMIHGGGWVGGSRHWEDYFSTVLASLGVVVLNIDYRLADKALPDTRWPAQLVDAQLAVRFLRAHADEYAIDPARFGAVGDSAGAQLAVFLGELPTNIPGDQAGLYPNERPNVKAVIDQFGPMDLPSMGNYGIGSIDAMFGTTTPLPSDLLTASPIPSVTAKTAPVYIVHGHGDQVVPFDNSQHLEDALRAHRVAVELVPYDGDHAFQGLTPEQVGKLQWDAIQWLLARLQK